MKYSSEYIEQYLLGRLSPEQMHEMEKAALDDPFLADMIEGMEKAMTGYREDVQALKDRIAEKARKKKSGGIWKVAATVIGAGMLAVLFFQLQPDNNEKTVAGKTTLPKKDSAIEERRDNNQKPETAREVTPEGDAPYALMQAEESRSETKRGSGKAEEQERSAVSDQSAILERQNPKSRLLLRPSELPVENESAAGEAAIAVDSAVTGHAPAQALPQALSGRVPGVVVRDKRDNVNSRNAAAQRKLDREINDGELAGSKRGDKENDSALANRKRDDEKNADAVAKRQREMESEPNIVTIDSALSNDTSLEEVVVAGYSTNKRRAGKRDDGIVNFRTGQTTTHGRPRGGWNAYEKYLKSNKKTDPADTITRGEVAVQFVLAADGKMSGFVIKKSLSAFYDREAIRLLRDGPGWRSGKKITQTITVSVEF